MRFDDFNHAKKLQKLVENYEKLIEKDKDRKENRLGVQEICRLEGSQTQSYFILDSQRYKVARKLYFGIKKENL